MRIKNCHFEKWSENHSDIHKDRKFRQLYPFAIFSQINFDKLNIGIEQIIQFNDLEYKCLISKIENTESNRLRATFTLVSNPKSNTQSWKKRFWDETFQIIYSKNYDFITVFTKKEDPSKDYIKRFYKGNFKKITKNRSIPLSDLLFKTLITTLSEDLFGKGDYYKEYKLLKNGYRKLENINKEFKIKPNNFFSPIYSNARKLWVCHSFNEEKAHRIAFYNANQCNELYVVYCNPTYTRHHRCKYSNVHIVSIYEFVLINSEEITMNNFKQIRFLQNHLNEQKEYSNNELINEINDPKSENYEIYKSELMEALAIMKITPNSNYQLFYYLSAMNLLNAWIEEKKKEKKEKLFSNMYFFKTYLSKTLENLISGNNFGAKIYLKPEIVIIELNNFQFSFHHIKMSKKLNDFMNSKLNIKIDWKRKRLKPISSLLFRYSQQFKLLN